MAVRETVAGVIRRPRDARFARRDARFARRDARFARRDALAARDPETDFHDIYRQLASLEFPWDLNQALSFALFRTYAVPTVADLLARTGEFTRDVQKRYDDTSLILDGILEHGPRSPAGRAAVRRMNQMHGYYDISNEDMRYVLATFVVTPVRWIQAYGWRALTGTEIRASVNYYRDLGSLMGIKQIPATYEEFVDFLDGYERATFARTDAGRLVADRTLDLMTTFPPSHLLPARLVRLFSYGLMDDPLLDAFGYPHPPRLFRAASQGAVRLRGRVVRRMRPRSEPLFARQLPNIRSYPGGYEHSELGVFAPGCPAHTEGMA